MKIILRNLCIMYVIIIRNSLNASKFDAVRLLISQNIKCLFKHLMFCSTYLASIDINCYNNYFSSNLYVICNNEKLIVVVKTHLLKLKHVLYCFVPSKKVLNFSRKLRIKLKSYRHYFTQLL